MPESPPDPHPQFLDWIEGEANTIERLTADLVAARTALAEATELLRAQPFNACPKCGLNAGRRQLSRVMCEHSWHDRNDAVLAFLASQEAPK